MGRLVGRKGKADRFAGDLNTTLVKIHRPVNCLTSLWKFLDAHGAAFYVWIKSRLNAPAFYALLVVHYTGILRTPTILY